MKNKIKGLAVKRLSKGELLAAIAAARTQEDERVTAMASNMLAPAALPSKKCLIVGDKRKVERISRGKKLAVVALARSLEEAKASVSATRVPPHPRLELPPAPYMGDTFANF